MRTFSRSVGFLVVLALSTLVVCAEPEGATTTGTSTATIEEKSARTEETKNAVSSASPDTQQKVHAKTPVVTTASKTEKAGTQHSTSASAPRQEMVSFTVNLPLNAIEGDMEESFFNDMFNSFGSFFSNLFAVEDFADDEEQPAGSDMGAAMGPHPYADKSIAGATADSSAEKGNHTVAVEDLLDDLDDSDFLSYLTSAYLHPLQNLMSSMMMGLDAYSPASTSTEQQKSSSGSSSGGGIFDLITQIMNSTPESLMGPEVTSNITSENCVFEVDLGTVPETATIIVGVEGDAVFVEYSNTIGEKAKKTEEATNVTAAEASTTSNEETPTGVTDETIQPNENYTAEKSTGNNLRGSSPAPVPTANVYSYERFVINPVCDYESVDAKAARVEEDKLLIKFPIKKEKMQEVLSATQKTTDTQGEKVDSDKKEHEPNHHGTASFPEKADTPSASPTLGVQEPEKKPEGHTAERIYVSSSRREQGPKDLSAEVRMAQKTPQTPHRRILPMVAAAEF